MATYPTTVPKLLREADEVRRREVLPIGTGAGILDRTRAVARQTVRRVRRVVARVDAPAREHPHPAGELERGVATDQQRLEATLTVAGHDHRGCGDRWRAGRVRGCCVRHGARL